MQQVLECHEQRSALEAKIAELQAEATVDRMRRLDEENERLRLMSEIALLRSHIGDTAKLGDKERDRLKAELADVREVPDSAFLIRC